MVRNRAAETDPNRTPMLRGPRIGQASPNTIDLSQASAMDAIKSVTPYVTARQPPNKTRKESTHSSRRELLDKKPIKDNRIGTRTKEGTTPEVRPVPIQSYKETPAQEQRSKPRTIQNQPQNTKHACHTIHPMHKQWTPSKQKP